MTQTTESQRHLRWRVEEFARSRGVVTVVQLSSLIERPRQSLYTIWRGEPKVVSLHMLASLCDGLQADPGGWFRWVQAAPADVFSAPSADGTRQLVWAIGAIIHERRLDATDVGYAAHMVPNAFKPILLGTTQFVFLDTLASLARALNLPLGDLFDWTSSAQTARQNVSGTALRRALSARRSAI